jgi:hypothetical protein
LVKREDTVPLSEEEMRLLEQMERALVADDPKLASTMRGTTLRAMARRRALIAAVAFVIGVAVLMTGAVTKTPFVGVIGFVVMLGSAYVALVSWRGQSHVGEQAVPPADTTPPPFSVIQGGRRKRAPKAPRAPRGRGRSRARSQSGSMMERFEERWRRRRGQGGF